MSRNAKIWSLKCTSGMNLHVESRKSTDRNDCRRQSPRRKIRKKIRSFSRWSYSISFHCIECLHWILRDALLHTLLSILSAVNMVRFSYKKTLHTILVEPSKKKKKKVSSDVKSSEPKQIRNFCQWAKKAMSTHFLYNTLWNTGWRTV